jgi:hypothetical protein
MEEAGGETKIPQTNTEPPKKGHKWLFWFLGFDLVLIIAGMGIYFKLSVSKPTVETKKNAQQTDISKMTGQFPDYQEQKSTVKPNIPNYSLKSEELANLKQIETAGHKFTGTQLGFLESKGFFTEPTAATTGLPDDMVNQYEIIGGSRGEVNRKPENTVFVTSDFLIHIYHVLIDRSFQKIEETKFQPELTSLTDALYADAVGKYQQEQDSNLKKSWKRISEFYLVPKVLLASKLDKPQEYFQTMEDEDKYLEEDKNSDTENKALAVLKNWQSQIPAEIYNTVEEEISLVMQAEKVEMSPLFGPLKADTPIDYTQFGPRSHYTKNSILRSYFRAMMWYGRQSFETNSSDLTRDAILMTDELAGVNVNGQPATKIWNYIYLPTMFFVGKSDDLLWSDYEGIIKTVFGSKLAENDLLNEAKLNQFLKEVGKIPGPKIMSDVKLIETNGVSKQNLQATTKGWRFMGQRFIPDSYMFSTLTQGDEAPDAETGQKLPSTPTALMIMSLLGSKAADKNLDEWIKTEAPQSDKVIAKYMNILRKEFDGYTEKDWTQNIYWSWLYNLKPLFNNFDSGYPEFMKGEAWQTKGLVTALGSWTELRHDTLLYAKQSYAELGGGPGDEAIPPVPKGYVEPNMDFLTRLTALATLTRDGLANNDLMESGMKGKFDTFITDLEFFRTMAEKELQNQIISDEDFENLRTIISRDFAQIVTPTDGGEMKEEDARVGIIADVHTDAKMGQILYEATGIPGVIYVGVKDANGTRLTRGVVYSYYEFSYPLGKRLTDQDWQGALYEGKTNLKIPDLPEWSKSISVK